MDTLKKIIKISSDFWKIVKDTGYFIYSLVLTALVFISSFILGLLNLSFIASVLFVLGVFFTIVLFLFLVIYGIYYIIQNF